LNSATRLSVFFDGSTGLYLAGYRTNTTAQSAHSVGVQGQASATATAWIGSCYLCYTTNAPLNTNSMIATNHPRIDIAVSLSATSTNIYFPITLIPPASFTSGGIAATAYPYLKTMYAMLNTPDTVMG
jgi:hypothetical protein